MEMQIITVAEYMALLKKLDQIDETISIKINPNKKVYSEDGLCELLSTSKRTLINWRKKRLIKFSKVQGKIFYTWENIEEFLNRFEVES